MPLFLYDSSLILLIPAFILAVWAQYKVRSTYRKYLSIRSVQGITGAQAAKYILNQNGIHDVEVEPVAGELSDHYDPRKRVVRLSEKNYHGNSLAALTIAAHEVGHVIQHYGGYASGNFRKGYSGVY